MSLAEAIAAAPPKRRGAQCSVAVFMAELSDADRADLNAAMEGVTQGSVIAAVLKAEFPDAQPPAAQSIQRHRNRSCRCP